MLSRAWAAICSAVFFGGGTEGTAVECLVGGGEGQAGFVECAFLAYLGQRWFDLQPHAVFEQASFGICLLELLVEFRFVGKQAGFVDAEDPEAVSAVVVAADESDGFEEASELFGGGSVDDLSEPGLGDGRGSQGGLTGGAKQIASAGDVEVVGRRHGWSGTPAGSVASGRIIALDGQAVACTDDVATLEASGKGFLGSFISMNENDGAWRCGFDP